MTQLSNQQLHTQLQQATQHLANGRRSEAASIYEIVAQSAGDDPALQAELGQLCFRFAANDKALNHFRAAADKTPEDAGILGFLGLAHLRVGELDAARDVLTKAKSIDADVHQVLYGLGILHKEFAEFESARDYLQRALSLYPKDSNTLTSLAQTLTYLDDYDQAMSLARRAARVNPRDPNAQLVIGTILAETGKTEEAIKHYEKMIRTGSNLDLAYTNLVRLKKFTRDDSGFIRKTEKSLKQGMAPRERIGVHYALGKMYDDRHEYDQAFEHFRNANLLEKMPYDLARDRKRFKLMRRLFTSNSIEQYASAGHESAVPVFIVGMPRSGTTLMERIIASHSQGSAAGELQAMSRIAHELVDDKQDRSSRRLAEHLQGDKARALAERYLKVLRRTRQDSARIVDKLPANYINLGLIASLFPRARIIHAERDPIDTCLSCYFQAFGQVGWANDLQTIADVYRLYRGYMDYWASVLPPDTVLNLRYETLIEQPETQARRMLAHCGLDWEAQCLDFHRSDGVVKTLSQWQVRQPIYQSSKRRWRNYADHVDALARQLADYLEDERELLAEHGISLLRRRFPWFS